jgi:hypothetical protein
MRISFFVFGSCTVLCQLGSIYNIFIPGLGHDLATKETISTIQDSLDSVGRINCC